MTHEFWEDENYDKALREYIKYDRFCQILDSSNPSNAKMFRLRDEFLLKMKTIADNYNPQIK